LSGGQDVFVNTPTPKGLKVNSPKRSLNATFVKGKHTGKLLPNPTSWRGCRGYPCVFAKANVAFMLRLELWSRYARYYVSHFQA